jgi:peptide/nickel transport system ATP-binding protein
VPPLLEVDHLRVEFPTRRGILTAVDDVSFSLGVGEILGVVGESGAGKSMTGYAIIGLLEPPGRIAGGTIKLSGERIDNLSPEALRRVRGREIGAIFQDPLTSLNPLLRISEPSLGTLVNVGNNFLFSGEWWIVIFPGATLALLVLAVNLLGDWLRDALNPRLR